ncbi:MAG: hypothetical protein ACAF41_33855 (plasmid) [Leptolyngbya sp. BL-A-14]
MTVLTLRVPTLPSLAHLVGMLCPLLVALVVWSGGCLVLWSVGGRVLNASTPLP